MNQLDVYYRALLEYRKLTESQRECHAMSSAIAEADTENDSILITRSVCTIDEDWVDAIEQGLIHVEKAIKQDRQFIRSNGEVVPIEKVKHVSKDTVEHLAKHSNLITRYEEGEDIIPDKLYTVERLNDYAVYENRFLYMLLCYLRDFITLRYNNILDLTNKYDGTVSLNKEISHSKERMTYTLTMHDEKRDDPYLKANNPAKAIIDRIDLILKTVLAFLATPLMEFVSKAPMLKPPITKTNVLKMDNSFKGAVALYDYIIAYDKPGYTIETETTNLAPLRDDLKGELAEAGALVAFLAYEYGLGIKQELKESYLAEEDRRREEEIKQRAEKIEALKRRLRASEIGIEEYTLTLEKQLRALEGESVRASSLSERVNELIDTQKGLEDTISGLHSDIEDMRRDTEELKRAHFEEMEAVSREHKEAMHELILKHEEKLLAEEERYRAELRASEERHNDRLREMDDRLKEAGERFRTALDEAQGETARMSDELASVRGAFNSLSEEKRLADARIKALGGITENYTDRESFGELEREYLAFTKLYKQQWSETKKQIRKNHLNLANLKPKKGEKVKKSDKKKLEDDSLAASAAEPVDSGIEEAKEEGADRVE